MKKCAISLILLIISLSFMTQTALADIYGTKAFEKGDYVGYLVDGKCDGFGTYTTDMVVYYGMFKDNTYNGFGIVVYSDGEPNNYKFQAGIYKNGKLEGQGAMTYINANGEYIRRAGLFATGDLVTGQFERVVNILSWVVIDETADSPAYTGEVIFGTAIPHGYGIFHNEEGYMHIGMFTEGKPDGYGIQVNPDNSYFAGLWEMGELIDITEWMGVKQRNAWDLIWLD